MEGEGEVLDLGTDGRAPPSPPTGPERRCSEDTGSEQPSFSGGLLVTPVGQESSVTPGSEWQGLVLV